MALEILDVAFVLLCFLKRVEGAEIASFAGGRAFLTREYKRNWPDLSFLNHGVTLNKL